MSEPKDGGPAFPVPAEQPTLMADGLFFDRRGHGMLEAAPGMSLRDYFAAKALQGLCSDPNVVGSNAEMALAAYVLADAMLAERERKR